MTFSTRYTHKALRIIRTIFSVHHMERPKLPRKISIKDADEKDDIYFLDFMRGIFNNEAYLNCNPDVLSTGVDPLEHWLNHGIFEGRRLGNNTTIIFGDDAAEVSNRRWTKLSWRGQPVAISMPSEDDIYFLDFMRGIFNNEEYLNCNPDVLSAGVDPLEHWLNHGIFEGRRLGNNTTIIFGDDAAEVSHRRWTKLSWRGQPVAISMPSIDQRIIQKIVMQGSYDPSVLAPGALSLSGLREFYGSDLLTRDGLYVDRIFKTVLDRPKMVVLMPFLDTGGAEKYAADIVRDYLEKISDHIVIIITESCPKDQDNWKLLRILEPLTRHGKFVLSQPRSLQVLSFLSCADSRRRDGCGSRGCASFLR